MGFRVWSGGEIFGKKIKTLCEQLSHYVNTLLQYLTAYLGSVNVTTRVNIIISSFFCKSNIGIEYKSLLILSMFMMKKNFVRTLSDWFW